MSVADKQSTPVASPRSSGAVAQSKALFENQSNTAPTEWGTPGWKKIAGGKRRTVNQMEKNPSNTWSGPAPDLEGAGATADEGSMERVVSNDSLLEMLQAKAEELEKEQPKDSGVERAPSGSIGRSTSFNKHRDKRRKNSKDKQQQEDNKSSSSSSSSSPKGHKRSRSTAGAVSFSISPAGGHVDQAAASVASSNNNNDRDKERHRTLSVSDDRLLTSSAVNRPPSPRKVGAGKDRLRRSTSLSKKSMGVAQASVTPPGGENADNDAHVEKEDTNDSKEENNNGNADEHAANNKRKMGHRRSRSTGGSYTSLVSKMKSSGGPSDKKEKKEKKKKEKDKEKAVKRANSSHEVHATVAPNAASPKKKSANKEKDELLWRRNPYHFASIGRKGGPPAINMAASFDSLQAKKPKRLFRRHHNDDNKEKENKEKESKENKDNKEQRRASMSLPKRHSEGSLAEMIVQPDEKQRKASDAGERKDEQQQQQRTPRSASDGPKHANTHENNDRNDKNGAPTNIDEMLVQRAFKERMEELKALSRRHGDGDAGNSRKALKRLSLVVDERLLRRPSYDSLVYSGIFKEWSDAGTATTTAPTPASAPHPPKDSSNSSNSSGNTSNNNTNHANSNDDDVTPLLPQRSSSSPPRPSMAMTKHFCTSTPNLPRSSPSTPRSKMSTTTTFYASTSAVKLTRGRKDKEVAAAEEGRANSIDDPQRHQEFLEKMDKEMAKKRQEEEERAVRLPKACADAPGWHVERGTNADFVAGAYLAVASEESDLSNACYYNKYFYDHEHTALWGMSPVVGIVILCVVGIEKSQHKTSKKLIPAATKVEKLFRVLVQTQLGTKQLFVRSGLKHAEIVKAVKVACGVQGYLPEIQEIKFKAIKDVDLREDLKHIEESFVSKEYKFGVLFCKRGQNENDMFSNRETSEGFERFLEVLGDKVELKGWGSFSGGLDTKNEATGSHSVFTLFKDCEIMFHVSTMLPFFPRDTQQVERKRHLGNDIVVIVYVEPGAQFNPGVMKTHFNHIYIVVAELSEEEKREIAAEKVDGDELKKEGDYRVRVEVAAKEGVRPFGPRLPLARAWAFDQEFRTFLLTKLVNGERAALQAPSFAVKLQNARKLLLEELVERIPK